MATNLVVAGHKYAWGQIVKLSNPISNSLDGEMDV